MYKNIKNYFHWKGLFSDVQSFVRRCKQCQKCKHSIPNIEPLRKTTTASSAFDKIYLDLMGPIEIDSEGNKYVLTIQCELSKYIEAFPLKNKEAVTVASSFVNNFILKYGIPRETVTDQGTEFVSQIFQEACKILNIKSLNSCAHHHETLGSIENSHKHLGAYLRMQISEHKNSWSSWLPFWCFFYNTTVHTETKYTPYELVFGKLARLPSNIEENISPLLNFDNYPLELKFRLQQASADAKENLENSKLKRKLMYDNARRNVNSIRYNVGDLVLVRNNNSTNKMEELFLGPYSVVSDEGTNVTIMKKNKQVIVHKNTVKKYFE